MRTLTMVVLVASLAAPVHADGKKYLACKKPKAEVFPMIVTAISEKWTIQSANETSGGAWVARFRMNAPASNAG